MERAKILIVSRLRWPSIARLADAFAAAGAEVSVICPFFHPLSHLNGLHRRFYYSLTHPRRSLRRAIMQSTPDLIIPCDDIAIAHLIEIRDRPATEEGSADLVRSAIERSLAPTHSYRTLASRACLIALASEEGVLAPLTEVVTSADAVAGWLTRNGAAYLKLDGSFGGEGIRELADPSQARSVFDELAAGPTAFESIREAILEQVFSKAKFRLGLIKPVVGIQKTIIGAPANCSFACWKGELLSVVAVKVLRTEKPRGIATHVVPIENEAMRRAARQIARRLDLTGIFGLDFVMEPETENPWLIELNARPTQVSHFRLGPDSDLIGALVSAITGRPSDFHQSPFGAATVVLFPHQLRSRERTLEDGGVVHDLPLLQPKLIRAFTPLRTRVRNAVSAGRRRFKGAADRSPAVVARSTVTDPEAT